MAQSITRLEPMWQIAKFWQDWHPEHLNGGHEDLPWRKMHEAGVCAELTRLQSEEPFTETIWLVDDARRYNYQIVHRSADRSLFVAQHAGGNSTVLLKQLNSLILRAEISVSSVGRDYHVTFKSLAGNPVVAGLFHEADSLYTIKWHLLQKLQKERKLTLPEIAETQIFLETNQKFPITGSLRTLLCRDRSAAPRALPRKLWLGRFARRTLLKRSLKRI